MLAVLSALRNKVAIGFVGGSDLGKQQEQLGGGSRDGTPSSPPLTAVVNMSGRKSAGHVRFLLR